MATIRVHRINTPLSNCRSFNMLVKPARSILNAPEKILIEIHRQLNHLVCFSRVCLLCYNALGNVLKCVGSPEARK